MRKPYGNYRGAILWEGPSPVNGAPIALIAVGFDSKGSSNAKTGKMIQTYIIRTDVRPDAAVKLGQDDAICGNCPHRLNPVTGERSCYVREAEGPLAVFRGYKRGIYKDLTGNLEEFKSWLQYRGRELRVGAYGDPAMVPFEVWAEIIPAAPSWTGYTHQWAEPFFDARLLRFVMASIEAEWQKDLLPAGTRFFRTKRPDEANAKDEISCVAETRGVSCADCRLCRGTALKGAKSITVDVHGARRKNFTPLPLVVA